MEVVDMERSSVTKMTEDFVKIGNIAKNHKVADDRLTVFQPSNYNVWSSDLILAEISRKYLYQSTKSGAVLNIRMKPSFVKSDCQQRTGELFAC